MSDVLFQTLPGPGGSVGLITLNRPNQHNALTHAMNVAIRTKLLAWTEADTIKAVIIRGSGNKAFCAGGDIRYIYTLRDQLNKARHFFEEEYALAKSVYHFPKPYIALMDGLTMGGGAGVSINGQYRIATERLKFAMPETGIGFFPDVGGSYFLSRCPGRIGWYLGLTGTTIHALDAYEIGLVDSVIKSENISAAILSCQRKLASSSWDWLKSLDASFRWRWHDNEAAGLIKRQPIIDRCFSEPSVEKIIAALDSESDEWAHQTAQVLRTRSPTSLKVVLEQLNRGAHLDFDVCIDMEYCIANRFLAMPDFYEGIRAAVIDKDRSPKWCPATLEEVDDNTVASYFSPLEA